jgi:hypothetical protein
MRRYALAFVLIAACGSSTAGGTDGGGAAGNDTGAAGNLADGHGGGPDLSPFHGGMVWKYDGVMHAAQVVIAQRRKDATIDFLEIIGAEASGDGLAVVLSDTTANKPAPLSGAYACPGMGGLYVQLTYNATGSNAAMSCAINVTQAGVVGTQYAVGTFSGVLAYG